MPREPVKAEDYAEKHARQFVQDMLAAGLTPYHYHGRFFWEGPAVDVDDLQDALSETKVTCQFDGMGRGYVVYPRQSATLLTSAEAMVEAAETDAEARAGT